LTPRLSLSVKVPFESEDVRLLCVVALSS
jgi:hypothetical protein